jgi:hypothetical protein
MNNKRLLITLGILGGIYGVWRFYLKDKIAEKKALKAVDERKTFDANREIIAQSLPQENPFNNTIDVEFENIG